jgi:hypothetical protein
MNGRSVPDVTFKKVSKAFGGLPVLNDVSFANAQRKSTITKVGSWNRCPAT